MTARKIASLLALFCLCARPLATPALGAADAEAGRYLGTDRASLFDAYVHDIRDAELLSKAGFKRLRTTWEKELARTRRRFLQARTREDVYYALLSLKNSIHDAHSDLTVPEPLRPRRGVFSAPLAFRPALERGTWRFVVAESSIAAAARGDFLVSLDGDAAAVAMDGFREWLGNSSPEQLPFEFARWLTRRDAQKEPLPRQLREVFVLRAPDGKEKTVAVDFSAEPEHDGPPAGLEPLPRDADYGGWRPELSGLDYRVYADTATKTAVLRYFSFSYDFKPAELWNRMQELSYKPGLISGEGRYAADDFQRIDLDRLRGYLRDNEGRFDKLLIDVRENRGGLFNSGLLSLLARSELKSTTRQLVYTPLLRRDPDFFAAVTTMAPPALRAEFRGDLDAGKPASRAFPFDCATSNCKEETGNIAPSTPALHYRLFLLSGPYCVSSCDQFVSIFADNKMGRLLGLPSEGASAPLRGRKDFVLADGERFSITLNAGVTYRANGEILEANPARPARPADPEPDQVRKLLATLP